MGPNFERLDARWNCQRGDRCWEAAPFARHWSGPAKPWFLAAERDKYEWLPAIADLDRACLGPRALLRADFASRQQRQRRNRPGGVSIGV